MSNIARIDLRRLSRAMDGRQINFMVDTDGDIMPDEKAREKIASYISEGFPIVPLRKDDTTFAKDGKDHSRLTRLKDKLTKLNYERMRMIAGFRNTAKIDARIAMLKEEIYECEAKVPRSLAKLIPKDTLDGSGLIKKMIKMHIAADVITEFAMVVRETMEKLGLETCDVFPVVAQIEKLTSKFASVVCHPEFAGLSDFMTTNAKLIDDINTIVELYLKENLK